MEETKRSWPFFSKTLSVPHNEAKYEELVLFFDSMIDEVGEDESHPLAWLMEVVGVLIKRYEDNRLPELSTWETAENAMPCV